MIESRLEDLEHALGYKFRNRVLAERALTHSSATAGVGPGELREDNEQLEYLGDAILEMLASEHLFQAFPLWSEGQLSKSRARIVNAASLSTAAQRLGLGGYLRLGRGEEKTGGRTKRALLGDAFEAVVAAIYLDGGLECTREFVTRTLIDAAIEAEGSHLGRSDRKSELQELLQARGLPPARYELVRESGPDHQKMFWVEVNVPELVSATGTGTNKKEAEQSAAAQALEQVLEQVQSSKT
jgi:ribonuclease III